MLVLAQLKLYILKLLLFTFEIISFQNFTSRFVLKIGLVSSFVKRGRMYYSYGNRGIFYDFPNFFRLHQGHSSSFSLTQKNPNYRSNYPPATQKIFDKKFDILPTKTHLKHNKSTQKQLKTHQKHIKTIQKTTKTTP